MFLANLALSVLRLCDTHELSYEAASERCDISSRYFGDIARGKTSPTILTLEKLCTGFELTPNELLLPTGILLGTSYCKPMPVTRIRYYHDFHGTTFFPVCPRCGISMDREFQAFCDRCGQCLSWNAYHNATLIPSKNGI